MTFNIDYLEEKYPNKGYNDTLHNNYDSYAFFNLPWIKKDNETKRRIQEDQEENEKLDKKIKSIPTYRCINVCKCGEEWKDEYADYQEGCYPYIAKLCRDCQEEENNRLDKLEVEVRRNREIEKFEEKIPNRFRGKLSTVKNRSLLTSNCSIMWGSYGTGKTWECYTLSRELFLSRKIKTWELISEMDLVLSLMDFDNREWRMNEYKNIDLLIVDEVGKSKDTDYNRELLFSILNHRYEWEKKTVLICNSDKKEDVRNLMPTAILDRYRENVVEMIGKSKRYEA